MIIHKYTNVSVLRHLNNTVDTLICNPRKNPKTPRVSTLNSKLTDTLENTFKGIVVRKTALL